MDLESPQETHLQGSLHNPTQAFHCISSGISPFLGSHLGISCLRLEMPPCFIVLLHELVPFVSPRGLLRAGALNFIFGSLAPSTAPVSAGQNYDCKLSLTGHFYVRSIHTMTSSAGHEQGEATHSQFASKENKLKKTYKLTSSLANNWKTLTSFGLLICF